MCNVHILYFLTLIMIGCIFRIRRKKVLVIPLTCFLCQLVLDCCDQTIKSLLQPPITNLYQVDGTIQLRLSLSWFKKNAFKSIVSSILSKYLGSFNLVGFLQFIFFSTSNKLAEPMTRDAHLLKLCPGCSPAVELTP